MNRLLLILLMIVCVSLTPAWLASSGPKEDEPKKLEKAPLGDRDDAVIQNKRFLKVRNETKDKLTVFLQYRGLEKDVWTWIPADPAKAADAISFEIDAGTEMDVKNMDEPVAASRMRIWATSPTQKWLKYKTKDVWLVPEKSEDGDHIYTAENVEAFTFVFSNVADKEGMAGDTDVAGEKDLPTEGTDIPPPPPDIPWDVVDESGIPAGGFPLIRNLSVMPVSVVGTNAMIRVKNLGHVHNNLGRRLIIQRMAPGAFPQDAGPIGPLFHFGVRTFFLVGLTPGDYVAYIDPGDAPPFHFNDKRTFKITAATYADLTVLPVNVVAGNAHIKVKNVGTAPALPGQHLKVMKLPGGPTIDKGVIGPLAVNGVKVFAPFALAPGLYKAFVSVGDPAPHAGNDSKIFNVVAASAPDLDVLPVLVVGGNVHIKVKNVGTAALLPGGPHLMVKKLPAGMPVDHGAIGPLPINGIKPFPAFPLASGNYRAYISPGDPAPHNGNDFDEFAVAAPAPDLAAGVPSKMGGLVKGSVKNNGPGPYPGGARQWHIEKKVGPMWVAVPTVGTHVIPMLGPGDTHPIQGTFTGIGMYRIRITPGDSNPGNDTNTKNLP